MEKCFKMFRVMALYINDKIRRLNTHVGEERESIKDPQIFHDDIVKNDNKHVSMSSRYSCQICDRNFVTEESLEAHKSYLHGNKDNKCKENSDKSESYEVVVEQIYENWSAKPNDGNTELVVKDVADINHH